MEDVILEKNEVPLDILKDCRIFHFGSISLTDEPCRAATLEAAAFARKSGRLSAMICFFGMIKNVRK